MFFLSLLFIPRVRKKNHGGVNFVRCKEVLDMLCIEIQYTSIRCVLMKEFLSTEIHSFEGDIYANKHAFAVMGGHFTEHITEMTPNFDDQMRMRGLGVGSWGHEMMRCFLLKPLSPRSLSVTQLGSPKKDMLGHIRVLSDTS